MRLFSAGYRGRLPENLMSDLALAGVGEVWDVRERPYQRPPYDPHRLGAAARAHGLGYALHPELGNPFRRPAWAGPLEEAEARYRGRIQPWLAERPRLPDGLALLCACAEASGCHRRWLAEALAAADPRIDLIHLRPDGRPPPREVQGWLFEDV